MLPNQQKPDTRPTSLQSTSVAATRPKLIIGGSFIIVLIIILLEIYAPRDKSNSSDANIQTETTIIPAAIEPAAEDGSSNDNP